MPYLKKKDKDVIDNAANFLDFFREWNFSGIEIGAGVLNYLITKLCLCYLETMSRYDQKEKYSHHNDVIGALECAKQEFYRRSTACLEDKKIKENGDVY